MADAEEGVALQPRVEEAPPPGWLLSLGGLMWSEPNSPRTIVKGVSVEAQPSVSAAALAVHVALGLALVFMTLFLFFGLIPGDLDAYMTTNDTGNITKRIGWVLGTASLNVAFAAMQTVTHPNHESGQVERRQHVQMGKQVVLLFGLLLLCLACGMYSAATATPCVKDESASTTADKYAGCRDARTVTAAACPLPACAADTGKGVPQKEKTGACVDKSTACGSMVPANATGGPCKDKAFLDLKVTCCVTYKAQGCP